MTNPIAIEFFEEERPDGVSGAEYLQRLIPDKKVVKAFNQTGVENLAIRTGPSCSSRVKMRKRCGLSSSYQTKSNSLFTYSNSSVVRFALE